MLTVALNVIREFWPSPVEALAGVTWGGVLLLVASRLATGLAQRGWRVGDTRKLFHFTIFTGAAVLRWQAGLGAVVAFGCLVAALVSFVAWRGHASPLFRALSRPSDAPREKLHVLSPLIGTAVGGVLAHLIAGKLAGVAYLVAGWGDAVGEPVGIRWGRHRYRVIACGIRTAERSWEGSAAVFAMSSVAAGIGLSVFGQSGTATWIPALGLGAAATVIEAVSPHGWDNLTLLISIAWLATVCSG